MNIRHSILGAALVLTSSLGASSAPPTVKSDEIWLGAWGFVPTPPPPGVNVPTPSPVSFEVPLGAAPTLPTPAAPSPPLVDNPGDVPVVTAPDISPANVSIRQLVRVAVASNRIRLRFSNEGENVPLLLGAVHIASAGPDGSIVPGTDQPVAFDGKGDVVIPAGAPLLSDPIDMKVDALQKLVVSIYVPGVMPRGHALFQYVAGEPGNHVSEPRLPNQVIMPLNSLVSEVDVVPVRANAVVVALGDSITEGAESTRNAFRSWPDRLAERLAAAHSNWSVFNAGIGGNRLLRYGAGPNALARLDRDVFSVPGAKTIILLEGINDIGRGFSRQDEPVTVEALEAADKQIIARAHAHGIRVIGATLTPFKGAGYFTADGETVREALNSWIRTSGAFDAVIDFASAVADPADPTSFRTDYNLKDKLHPNDEGYQAMANAIDLTLITGK